MTSFANTALVILTVFAAAISANAATVVVPNPSFEQGVNAPDGWRLSGGLGAWELTGAAGRRSVSVTGGGNDQNAWEAPGLALAPGHRYRLRFKARREGSGDGTATAGPSTNNRDFSPGLHWTAYSFVFRTRDSNPGILRFGQWHNTGKTFFDDISLTQAVPVYRRRGALELGQGERVQGTVYEALTDLGGDGSNDARFLESHTAGFNSDRWLIGPDAIVTYRHQAGGYRQLSASLTLHVNYFVSGVCQVEARGAGAWVTVGTVTGLGDKSLELPPSIFPAPAVEVRLKGAPDPGTAQPCELQIDHYQYTARLDAEAPAFEGATHYAEIQTQATDNIAVTDWGSLEPGPDSVALVKIGSDAARVTWQVEASGSGSTARGQLDVPAARQARTTRLVKVPYVVQAAGPGVLALAVYAESAAPPARGTELFSASVPFQVAALDASDSGYPVLDGSPLWWIEGSFKVGRSRPAPVGKPKEIELSAAGGEEESFQLVLRPGKRLDNTAITLPILKGPGGTIPISAWKVRHVVMVPVTRPSDAAGAVGDWPDPLPPYTGPFTAEAGQNHPLWMSVQPPPGTPAGDYRGSVVVTAPGARWAVPVRLHVWAFDLPAGSHLRSAMGISPGSIRQYHNLKTDAELRQVWDLYMLDFAAHRLCPSNAMALDPIRVSIVPDGDAKRVVLDTAAFDRAAHHYLDEMGFTAFDLPVEGMGGGTFFARKEGVFGGFKAGTPEYETLWGSYVKQLEEHLRQKGWLRKAYVYWFDEPSTQDFPFVREGMARLKREAPGLVRLLTKEPRPELAGSVDLWCPILNAYDPVQAHERQKAGDEVWWYICTGPKTPYPGEFIDRPGTDLRDWVWETWRNHVQGLLIWEVTYWTSSAAYPHEPQDPWTDPMSWVSGYGAASGSRQPWGNGDGRFLYPPTAAQRASGKPILTGPVDFTPLGGLREGLEDYEYFRLLQERIEAGRTRGVTAAELRKAEALLNVPTDVARSLTEYSADPRPMYRHREELAKEIERLPALEAKR